MNVSKTGGTKRSRRGELSPIDLDSGRSNVTLSNRHVDRVATMVLHRLLRNAQNAFMRLAPLVVGDVPGRYVARDHHTRYSQRRLCSSQL